MIGKDGNRGFVVFTAPRSGSTWLLDLLNRTTCAKAYTELFIPRRRPREERLMTPETAEYLDVNLRGLPLFCEMTRKGLKLRPARTFDYLHQLFGRSGVSGFKLMYSNVISFPEVWAFVVWHQLPVVHLVRRNHLDVYISSQIRHATLTAHGLVGEPETRDIQIELNISELLRAMQRSRRNIQIARWFLRGSFVPHLEVHYEDLQQEGQLLRDVYDFLGLAREKPRCHSRLRKLVRGPHSQLIKNYADVRRAIDGTEFEGLLQ